MIEEKTDYFGNDIKQGATKYKVVENQEACAKLAAANEKALFWTYRPSDKKCWIKTSKAGKRALKTFVSGNKECGDAEGDAAEEGDAEGDAAEEGETEDEEGGDGDGEGDKDGKEGEEGGDDDAKTEKEGRLLTSTFAQNPVVVLRHVIYAVFPQVV